MSKNRNILIAIIFGLLLILAGFAGWLRLPESDQVNCTMDAKICPDGLAVGRTGPDCEFAACRDVPSLPVGYSLDNYKIEKVTGPACDETKDCSLPADYAVQSRCPFVSLCLANKCTVVCPPLLKEAVFACGGGESIKAKFYIGNDTKVDLQLSDGRKLSLPRAMSGSGARYANTDESFVFWNKGDTAFITEKGETTYDGCAVSGQ